MFKYVWIIMLAIGYVAGWAYTSYSFKEAYKNYKNSRFKDEESFIHYLWCYDYYDDISDFAFIWIMLNIVVAFIVSLIIFIVSKLG